MSKKESSSSQETDLNTDSLEKLSRYLSGRKRAVDPSRAFGSASNQNEPPEAINKALQTFGVLPSSSGEKAGCSGTTTWRRPFDFTLYSIPVQPALTSVVFEDGQYKDVSLLEMDGTCAAAGDLARPLAGNLSGKLTEFTRGTVGRRNPFRAGGLDDPEQSSLGGDSDDGHDEPLGPMQTAADLRRIMNEKGGSLKAWLTSEPGFMTQPPGVSVGIEPDQIYEKEYINSIKAELGNNIITRGEGGVSENNFEAGNEGMQMKATLESKSNTAANIVGEDKFDNPEGGGSGLWVDQFEDDSLFGDDSSSSGYESLSSASSLDGTTCTEKEASNVESSIRPIHIEESKSAAEGPGQASGSDEELDLLLDALSPKTTDMHRRKALKPHMAPTYTDKTTGPRKSWAVTASLDVSDFHSLVPDPAISYPFELDDFQKQAVARLERSECIFVAAHTSAGKTVCAEYAIALARKHCTRAIYTSPIKALSNQKYRDFKVTFGDVGLLTGDMQIAADSSCLVMTTEILRSMLYRGADLVRDIEWVIFDEVHYINDSERGVVWEEVIIMLPSYVNLIFLSATTPNTIEFSDWIGRTKRKPVHVIRTNYRPVPLSHNLFAGLKLHKIMEGKLAFMDVGYRSAGKALSSISKDKDKKGKGKGDNYRRPGKGAKDSIWNQQGNKQNWTSLVKFLEREELMPTVIFSFSKKKCEEIANMLRTMELNTTAEKGAVYSFTQQAISRLSPVDASLPQVLTVCEMVKRGIGVHHGGLLPILKEMVEILFSRNLIKVLFATETFAMGVNMPARAVVFNSIRKHDGTQFRILQPGEYTQMAGRAGRRGLDTVGTVILCCFGEEPPPQVILKNMLLGTSTKLQSQFRLTYNMILNLLRVEDMSVEDMIKRSFSEFATQRALTANEYPKLLAKGLKTLAKLDENFEVNSPNRIGAEDVQDYFATSVDILTINRKLHSHILAAAGGGGGGALVTGRVLLVTNVRQYGYVKTPALVLRPPMMLNTSKQENSTSIGVLSGVTPCICFVLLPTSHVPNSSSHSYEVSETVGGLHYIGLAKNRYYAIHEINLDQILYVTQKKEKLDSTILFKDAKSNPTDKMSHMLGGKDPFAKMTPVSKRVVDDPFAGFTARSKKRDDDDNVSNKSSKSLYPMAADKVMNVLLQAEEEERNLDLTLMNLRDCTRGVEGNMDFRTDCDYMDSLIHQLRSYESHIHPQIEKYYSLIERKETLRARVNKLRHVLSNEGLELFPDFLQRKSLLRALGYIDKNDVVCLKGRVACEVNTCEELIVTELILQGVLNEMEPAEIVAALSALVFQEKNDNVLDSELPESLASCCIAMKNIALDIGKSQQKYGLKIDPVDYCDGALKFGLVHPVYEWALGIPFRNICELTLVQEGSIVRCITRLDELCRDVRNCARVVGNPTLYRKMEEASAAIKRDIVFASSLYVT